MSKIIKETTYKVYIRNIVTLKLDENTGIANLQIVLHHVINIFNTL